jgi:hypothetical protein
MSKPLPKVLGPARDRTDRKAVPKIVGGEHLSLVVMTALLATKAWLERQAPRSFHAADWNEL